MRQLGLFIFWIVAEQCGRSRFNGARNTANRQEYAFVCLTDLCAANTQKVSES